MDDAEEDAGDGVVMEGVYEGVGASEMTVVLQSMVWERMVGRGQDSGEKRMVGREEKDKRKLTATAPFSRGNDEIDGGSVIWHCWTV